MRSEKKNVVKIITKLIGFVNQPDCSCREYHANYEDKTGGSGNTNPRFNSEHEGYNQLLGKHKTSPNCQENVCKV